MEDLFVDYRQWQRYNFSPEYEKDEPEFYPDPDEKYDEKDIDNES